MYPSLVESTTEPELTKTNPNPDGVGVKVEFDESDEKRRDEVGEQDDEPQVLADEVSTRIRLAAVCSEIQAIVVATITECNDTSPRLGPLWGQQAELLTRLTKEQGEMALMSYSGGHGFKNENMEDEEARLQRLRQEKEELQRQNALLKKRGLEVAAALTREVNLAEDERCAGRQAVERKLHSLDRERLKINNDRERLQKDCTTLHVELERYKQKPLDMERVRTADLQRQEETLAALKQEFERKLEERSRQQQQHQLLPTVKYAATTPGSQGFLSSAVVRKQSLAIDLEEEERWKQFRRNGIMFRVFIAWQRAALSSRSERIRNRASSIVHAEEALARKESALSSLALSLDTLDESLRQRETEVETCKTELTNMSRKLSQDRKADEKFRREMEELVKNEHERAEEAEMKSLRALKEAEELRFELEGIKENRNTEDSKKFDIMRSSLASEIDELHRNMEAEKFNILDREALLEVAKRDVEAKETQLEEERMKLDLRTEEIDAQEKRLRRSTETLDQRESVIQEIRHQACQMSESLAIQQQQAAELDERLNERERVISEKEMLLDSRHVKVNEMDKKLTAQKMALDAREKSVTKTSNELSSQIEHVEQQAKLAKGELEMALEVSRRELKVKQTRLEQAEKNLIELNRRIMDEKARCDALSSSSEEASAREIAVREEVYRVEEELERSLARIRELTADCAGNTQRLKDMQKRLEVERQEVERVSSEACEEKKVFEMERAQALELRNELTNRHKEFEQQLLSATEDSNAEALRLKSLLENGRKDRLSLERMCKAQEVQIESISVELEAARKDETRDLLAARAIADDLKSQLKHARSQLDDVSRYMGECSMTHSNQLSMLQEQLDEAKHHVEVVHLQMRDLSSEHVEQLKVAEQEAVALRKEMSVLSNDLNKLRRDVNRSETDKRKLFTSSEEDKRELIGVTEELSRLKMQTEESARQMAEDKTAFASELANLKQYQSKSIELQKQNQKLEETISALSRQVEESVRRRAEAKSEFDSELLHFEQFQQISIQLQTENQQLGDQVSSLTSQRDRKASELAVLVETKEREMSEIKEWMKLWSKGKDEDLNKLKTQCKAANAAAGDELTAAKLRISELKSCETDAIRLRDEVKKLRDSENTITAQHEVEIKELLHRCGAMEDHAESTSLEVQHLLKVNTDALREEEIADTAKAELKQEYKAMQYKLSSAEERLTASEVNCLELEGRLKESVDTLEDNEQQLHLLEAATEASCDHVDDLKKQLALTVNDFEQCRILLETCQNELQESRTSRVELTRKLKSEVEELANRDSRLQLKLKERTSRLKDCEASLKDQSDKIQGYRTHLGEAVSQRDKYYQNLEKLRNEFQETKNREKKLSSVLKEAQKLTEEKDEAFVKASQCLKNMSKEMNEDRELHTLELSRCTEVENNLRIEAEAAVVALRKEKETHLAELERVARETELRLQDQWDSVKAQNAENNLQKQRLSDQAASLESVRVALEKAESVAAEEVDTMSERAELIREEEERLKQRTKELNDMEDNIREQEKAVLDNEISLKIESERLADERYSVACEVSNLRTRQENVEEESLCLEESLKTLEERFEQELNSTEVTKKILQATQEGLGKKEVDLTAQENEIELAREEMEDKLNTTQKELNARRLQHEAWEREAMLKMDEAEAKLIADKEDLQKRVFEMDLREREFSTARETMQIAVEELEKRRQQLEERESSCNTIQDELVKARLSLEVMQRKKEENDAVAKNELQLAREAVDMELSQQDEERAMLEEMHQQAVKRKEDIEEEFVKLVQEREELVKLRDNEVQRNLELHEDNKKAQFELQRERAEIEYKQAILLRDTDTLEKEKAALHFAKQQVAVGEASISRAVQREKQLIIWAGKLAQQGDALKAQASRLAQAHQSLRDRELRSAKEEIMPNVISLTSSFMQEESMQMLEAERLALDIEKAALKVKKDELQRERTELEGVKDGKKVGVLRTSGNKAPSFSPDIDNIDWTCDFPNAYPSRDILEFSLLPPLATANDDNSKKIHVLKDDKLKAKVEEDEYHNNITAAAAGVLSTLSQTDPPFSNRAIGVASTLADLRKGWQSNTSTAIFGLGPIEQQQYQLLRPKEATTKDDVDFPPTTSGSGHSRDEKWNDDKFSIEEESSRIQGLKIELEAETQLLRAERERLLTDRASLNRRMEAVKIQEAKYETETEMAAAQLTSGGAIIDTGVMMEEEKENVIEIAQLSQLPDDAIVVDKIRVGCVMAEENENVVVEEDISGAEMQQHRNMTETEIHETEEKNDPSTVYPSSIEIDYKEGKHDDEVELNKEEEGTTTGVVIIVDDRASTLPVVDSAAALSLGEIHPSIGSPNSKPSHPTSPSIAFKKEDIAEETNSCSWQQQTPSDISELPAQVLVGSSAAMTSVSTVVGCATTEEEKCSSLAPSPNNNRHGDIEFHHQQQPLLDENENKNEKPYHHISYDGLTMDDATLEGVKLRLAGSSHELQKGLGQREALLSGFGMSSDGGLLYLSESEEYSGRSSWTSGEEYVEKKAREEDDDVMKQRWPIAEFVEMQKPLFPTAVPQENVDDSPRTMSSSHGQSLSPGPSLNDERDYEIDEERNRLRELMMSVKGLETSSEKTLSNIDEEEEKDSSSSSVNLSLSDLDEGQSKEWQGHPPHPLEPLTVSAIRDGRRSDLSSQLRELTHLVSDSSERSGSEEESSTI